MTKIKKTYVRNGKLYEQIFGKERAKIIKLRQKNKTSSFHLRQKNKKRTFDSRKGKTWEEIYGIEYANKRKKEHSERFKGKVFGHDKEYAYLSWEEKIGKERADELKQKLSKHFKGKTGYKHSKENIEKIRAARLKQRFILKDTSIEIAVQTELYKRQIEFDTQIALIKICIADVFIKPNIVIFCDGDYWHNYPDGNERDHAQNKALKDAGYIVLRFWERDINKDIKKVVDEIEKYIKQEVIIKW